MDEFVTALGEYKEAVECLLVGLPVRAGHTRWVRIRSRGFGGGRGGEAAGKDQPSPSRPGAGVDTSNPTGLVLRALVARDKVARLLPASESMDEQALGELFELDERLRSAAIGVDELVGHKSLSDWRESVQPPGGAWWWFLDEQATSDVARRSAWWILLAALFLALSISISTDITRRFLANGLDTIGSLSTLVQAMVTVVAGRTLLSSQSRSFTILGHLGQSRPLRWIQLRHNWKFVLSAIVLALIVALRLSLPAIAQFYNSQALRSQQRGSLSSAIEDYKRSISLDPDSPNAHYDLADAYEQVLDYDNAQTEYKTAILADPQLYAPYNNLARLYMVRGSDFAGALMLLDKALGHGFGEQLRPDERYTLLKNRGWAYFGLGDYVSARDDLDQALKLRPDGSAAHCLLAQVQEKSGQPALTEWEACLGYAAGDPVQPEPAWISTARQTVNKVVKK